MVLIGSIEFVWISKLLNVFVLTSKCPFSNTCKVWHMHTYSDCYSLSFIVLFRKYLVLLIWSPMLIHMVLMILLLLRPWDLLKILLSHLQWLVGRMKYKVMLLSLSKGICQRCLIKLLRARKMFLWKRLRLRGLNSFIIPMLEIFNSSGG